MDMKCAAYAAKKFFNFKTIIPCHFGTFPILDQGTDAFLLAMGDQAARVRTPAVGETVVV